MNISIIAFTEKGAKKAQQVEHILKDDNCELFGKPVRTGLIEMKCSLSEWCMEQFQTKDAIIFVSATGIAVRGIAGAVKDKFHDAAVLVIDEQGQFVIPLLSGHVGGANDLAKRLAEALWATPVITTATDLSNVFAVDVFAKKNQLKLDDSRRQAYKEISAALLEGEKIGIWISPDISYDGKIPDELTKLSEDEWKQCLQSAPVYKYVIAVTDEILPEQTWIVPLVPVWLVLGAGCKKNTSIDKMRAAFETFIRQQNIDSASIRAIASIDLKQWEPALLSLAERLELPFHVYSAELLKEIEGDFATSDFVSKVTGVDNVCERAAMAGLLEYGEAGEVLTGKTVFDGITFALAGRKEDRRIDFG